MPTTLEAAAAYMAGLIGDEFFALHIAGHMSCFEANALADVMILVGNDKAAETLISGHAEGDNKSTDHHHDIDPAAFVADRRADLTTAVQASPERPAGQLVCPGCGNEVITLRQSVTVTCDATVYRETPGTAADVDEHGVSEVDDADYITYGVECTTCDYEYDGADWADQLVAATIPANEE